MARKIQIMFSSEEELIKELNAFEKSMRKDEISENTIKAYSLGVRQYFRIYNEVTQDNLLTYKSYLMESYKMETANQKLGALNRYFKWKRVDHIYRMKKLKTGQRASLENVISMQDFRRLKKCLLEDNYMVYYFLVWAMGVTGARISEILMCKVEDIECGCMDFYGKGRKQRKIYFTKPFQKECLDWLYSIGRDSGYVFINEIGNVISPNLALKHLKTFSKWYKIDPKVMHPHSFRHMFGKNFYKRSNNLTLLADILGHTSINTTKIYTRMTQLEQIETINKVVTW